MLQLFWVQLEHSPLLESAGSNFAFVCFRQLVSSYKGKFGFVQYFVKALMERPSQPALECKKHFEVEEPIDVNTPDLLVSVLFPISSILIAFSLRINAAGSAPLMWFGLMKY